MFSKTVAPEFLFEHEIDCKCGPIKSTSAASWRLPDLQQLYGGSSLTKAYVAWHAQALFLRFEVEAGQISVAYPDIEKGDAIEVFIDTRNVKTARSTHRYYHHFFFLPERIEGIQGGEITRFRTEDRHPLAQEKDFILHIETTKKGYTASIEIAAECLHGYQPEAGERMGFYFRVHRHGKEVEEWAYTRSDFNLHHHPHLFPTLLLRE